MKALSSRRPVGPARTLRSRPEETTPRYRFHRRGRRVSRAESRQDSLPAAQDEGRLHTGHQPAQVHQDD